MRTVLALSLLVAACGDDGGSSNSDARQVGDSAPVECLATDAYGAATLSSQKGERSMDSTFFRYFGGLNADADVLYFELLGGFGVFEEAPIAPGTYSLTGAESTYDTCGACVEIDANVDGEGNYDQTYFADGGTLVINTVTPNLTGTLTNVTFRHVNIDPDSFETTRASDCMATLQNASFDVTPEVLPDEDEGDGLRTRYRIQLGKKQHHRQTR